MDIEPDWEKLAIYTQEDGSSIHAGRQLEEETLTSKLGEFKDIQHANLNQMTRCDYGRPLFSCIAEAIEHLL
ncbi:hypothetical protein KZZ20_10410 [Methylacidiphilum fumariolicum]|uniref:DUF7689 domain-containing protein n=2 Tax=Candidatus Methylacidiphilum fumarolicum TaxID=591154 RepID=I0K1H6_METFB|nr:hypothetical protein [Candidatus Methylacidiphilum fumarolicum]MBW6415914.1 hypothetical protein [Candidatus Methylacidiphilum fumarolicum]CAI9084467.1 conserved protein of unknown function [Candidatus Methylacidiphilum fumarolicum]CCG93345.1 hypothetical protein MFUM_980013 [Methylacidiphilum fumariolicum SolV]